jgi:hypothetical protein
VRTGLTLTSPRLKLPAMSDPSDLRASDQDRESTAAEIREHFAAGRLDDDELSTRLGAAYAARTTGELQAVRADLPKLPATRAAQQAELAERRGELSRRLLQQTGAGMVPFVICTVVWLASGATGAFWPVWVALVAVLPLLRNGWHLYGPAPELDRVERHLQRREQAERDGAGDGPTARDGRGSRDGRDARRQQRRSDRRRL